MLLGSFLSPFVGFNERTGKLPRVCPPTFLINEFDPLLNSSPIEIFDSINAAVVVDNDSVCSAPVVVVKSIAVHTDLSAVYLTGKKTDIYHWIIIEEALSLDFVGAVI